jgi:hypothetical protein
MWNSLKEGHSWQTLANTYVKFKGILDTRIPEDQSSAPALTKIQAHIEQLSNFHIDLDEYIYLMIMVNKTLGYAQTQALILVMAQEMVDTLDKNISKDKHSKPLEYAKMLKASWKQCRLCSSNGCCTKNANRITAVKNKGKDPQFNQQQCLQEQQQQQQQQRQQRQQQQQAGGSSSNSQNGKKKRHGKQAGKNQEDHHDHSNIAAPAFISPPPAPLTPPKQPLEPHIKSDRLLAPKDKGQFPYF